MTVAQGESVTQRGRRQPPRPPEIEDLGTAAEHDRDDTRVAEHPAQLTRCNFRPVGEQSLGGRTVAEVLLADQDSDLCASDRNRVALVVFTALQRHTHDFRQGIGEPLVRRHRKPLAIHAILRCPVVPCCD